TFQESCREHPVIHPPPGQQLERFARTQGRAAGGVQVTMDRGEEQAHGIPGGKAVKRCLDRAGSARNEPVAIALMPSRRDHLAGRGWGPTVITRTNVAIQGAANTSVSARGILSVWTPRFPEMSR